MGRIKRVKDEPESTMVRDMHQGAMGPIDDVLGSRLRERFLCGVYNSRILYIMGGILWAVFHILEKIHE
jgi:hypothetical protein